MAKVNTLCEVCGSVFREDPLVAMHQFRPRVCGTGCLHSLLTTAGYGCAEKNLLKTGVSVFQSREMDNFRRIFDSMRSKWERSFANWLMLHQMNWGADWWYEPYAFELPHRTYRSYVPDFLLRRGIFVEIKGRWNEGDKTKVKLFYKTYHYPIFVIDATLISQIERYLR